MAEADELEDQLQRAEVDVAKEVATVLAEIALEFAAELEAADEIVAARFSVSRIARMWTSRMPRVVRRLLRVAETAAENTADTVELPLPDGWDDLPGRYDDDRELPPGIGQYVETTEHLLRAVGDHISDVAVRELAAGMDEGETIDQLRTRLRVAFRREGAQLGTAREERIAITEAGRAWNTSTLAAAQALDGPDRPLVKQWTTRRDKRVRDAHDKVDGQLRLLDEPFTVAGVEMSAPLDPSAPAALTVNCRCRLAVATADRTAAYESQTPARDAAKNRRKDPGVPDLVTAAADGDHHTGAMIALVPTQEDAERLAIDGGETADELHLTLYFLGEGADWSTDQRNELIDLVRSRAEDLEPITARAFGANHWNAGSDTPSWVWAVGDDRDRPQDATTLETAHYAATYALEDRHGPDIPVQHSPWSPHVCAVYSGETWPLELLLEQLGPITFDRIRLAFEGEVTDIPLGTTEESMDTTDDERTAAGMQTRAWSTPDETALAFEDQETGDGRVFAPGALFWEGGPWPLQYADEMLMGHQGAELAGAIETIDRQGGRIAGSGVIYADRAAGADAIQFLDEKAPLGVSVDLDDVDIEFVDKTMSPEDAELYGLVASLASLSVLRLEDGALMLTASSAPVWTASGNAMARNQHSVQFITGPGGRISREALRTAFAGTTFLTAAAGDRDDPDSGVVVHSESAGDLLVRITRARMRGATLVAMPAYSNARIVLDPVDDESQEETAAAGVQTAAGVSDTHRRVVAYVRASPIAVGAREVGKALGLRTDTVRGHLSRAVSAGTLVRLAPGQFVGASTMPEGAPLETLAEDDTGELTELEASAWTAMRDTDPMPAAWFQEPTDEELPPGSGGVHYSGGRIFGWVAQAGEPHAGYPGRQLTIESLGDIDTSHFLRARFQLDDGSTVKAGAFTMNAPHHRDGAECENASCQFDDTRTVAGIVTVGMNARGMWFSGAASPWLSEWDRRVFSACQPSYHMKQGAGSRWQLRAVLSVPVPGHSSPLLATAVAERANLALAASASAVLTSPDTMPGHQADVSGQPVSGHVADTSGQMPAPAELLAALTADPTALDDLLTLLQQRQADQEAERRAEIERLTAAVSAAAIVTPPLAAAAHSNGDQ
ncbi:phage minor head protein [Streptomyces sp. B21-089]|uniref:phage minor head protein n=1 Tax=Streptomyces sp. B21-089 TaxID=3039412 RepID=UPI002FEFAE58